MVFILEYIVVIIIIIIFWEITHHPSRLVKLVLMSKFTHVRGYVCASLEIQVHVLDVTTLPLEYIEAGS